MKNSRKIKKLKAQVRLTKRNLNKEHWCWPQWASMVVAAALIVYAARVDHKAPKRISTVDCGVFNNILLVQE